MVIRGKANVGEAIAYWIAQFLAAFAAATLVAYLFGKQGTGDCAIPPEGIAKAIVAEVVGTFALAYVILNVATTKGTAGNSFYGLAIGATVLAMAKVVGDYSGGAFNPAVALGLCIQKSFCWSQLWIYVVSCLAGGALAAIVFNYINEDDRTTPPIPPAE
jgi:aquaporin Z